MSAIVDVNLDQDHMILTWDGGTPAETIPYGKMEKLKLSRMTVKRLFRSSTVQLAEIHVRGAAAPYTISSDKLKSFDQTILYLQKFAEKNKVIIEK